MAADSFDMNDLKRRMQGALASLKQELGGLRTGRASTSLVELALWGAAITLVQLLVFRIADLVLKGLPQRVEEGEVSAAVLLVAAKLACSVLLAAAVAG